MRVGDTVVLVGLVKASHLNGKVARIAKKDEGDRWLVNLIEDAEKTMISVKEESMVTSTSHKHRSSGDEIHDTNILAPGAKVMLHGLKRCTLTYKDESWPDQSRLNGSIGHILRREKNYWIVELESDSTEFPVKAEHLRFLKTSPEKCKTVDVRNGQERAARSNVSDRQAKLAENESSRILAPRLRGILHKRGYWNATWKARYFVQTPRGELEYYEVEDRMPKGEAIGVIPIAMQAGCIGSDNETVVRSAGREAEHYLLEVEVKGPGPNHGRTFVLGAETYAERDEWVASLRLVAEAWRAGPTARTASSGRELGRTPSPEEPSATWRKRTATPELQLRTSSSEGDPEVRSASAVRLTPPSSVTAVAKTGREEAVGDGDSSRGRLKSGGAEVTSPRASRGAEGILYKRGYWNPAWKERYFVLTPHGDLEYYKVADGAPRGAPAGVIPVALRAGYCGESEETVVRAGGRDGRMGVIELTVRMAGPACGRTFVLGATSGAEHERWVTALRRVAGEWRGEEPGRDSFGRAGSREAVLSPRTAGADGDSQPEPLTPPADGYVMTGSLEKRGRINAAWKQRHFALTADGELRYYASEAEWRGGEPPKGRVSVAMPSGCWGRAHETLINEGGRDEGRAVVEIHVQAPGPQCDRVLVLGAPSRAAQREWAEALRRAAQAWRTASSEEAFSRAASAAATSGRAQSQEALGASADPRRTKRLEDHATGRGSIRSPEAPAHTPAVRHTTGPGERATGIGQGRLRSPEAPLAPADHGYSESSRRDDPRRSPELLSKSDAPARHPSPEAHAVRAEGRRRSPEEAHPQATRRPASEALSRSAANDLFRRCETSPAASNAMSDKEALRAAIAGLWGQRSSGAV